MATNGNYVILDQVQAWVNADGSLHLTIHDPRLVDDDGKAMPNGVVLYVSSRVKPNRVLRRLLQREGKA